MLNIVVLFCLVGENNQTILHSTLLASYDIRFNCCSATRPILNKAQEAAANSGNKTTRSLVSAIKVNFCLQYIKYFLFEYYYTSFITLVLKTKGEFFLCLCCQ